MLLFFFSETDTTFQGELEHRHVKRQYPRAHKGKFARGIAKQMWRERIMHNILNRYTHLKVSQKRKRGILDNTPIMPDKASRNLSIPCSSSKSESLPAAPPNQHYQMSTEICHKVPISVWLGDNKGDPALKVSHDSPLQIDSSSFNHEILFIIGFSSSPSRSPARTPSQPQFYWG